VAILIFVRSPFGAFDGTTQRCTGEGTRCLSGRWICRAKGFSHWTRSTNLAQKPWQMIRRSFGTSPNITVQFQRA